MPCLPIESEVQGIDRSVKNHALFCITPEDSKADPDASVRDLSGGLRKGRTVRSTSTMALKEKNR